MARVEKIALFQEAGLEAMRLKVNADGCKLDQLRSAVGCIPTVTMEVPAISWDYSPLRGLLPEPAAATSSSRC